MNKYKWIILGLAVVTATGCTIDVTPHGSYYYHSGYGHCDDYYYSPGYIHVETYEYHGHDGHYRHYDGGYHRGHRKRCR